MSQKMIKGTQVKLNDSKCFTVQGGGARPFPLSHYAHDEAGIVESFRPTTHEERIDWANSAMGRGMTDCGETKIPPRAVCVLLNSGRIYEVIRSRCRLDLGTGRAIGGMAQIKCVETGEFSYIKRDLLELA